MPAEYHACEACHIPAKLKAFALEPPSCSANTFAKKVASAIPEPLQPALIPILETIASLSQQIRAYDRQIEALCESKYPETKLLRNVSGVGPLTLYPHPGGSAALPQDTDPRSVWSPSEINPEIAIPSCASRTPSCAACSSHLPSTSSGPSDRTATCVGGDCGSPRAVERTPK